MVGEWGGEGSGRGVAEKGGLGASDQGLSSERGGGGGGGQVKFPKP